MDEPILSPDGNFMWTGSEWIPAPPPSNPSSPQPTHYNPTIEPTIELISPTPPNFGEVSTPYFSPAPPDNIVMLSNTGKSSTPFIVLGVIVIVIFASVGLFFIFNSSGVVKDDVTFTYFVVHTCDRVLVTYADGEGNILQDYDYYEGDFYIQYIGEMEDGDTMVGVASVSNFDDESCGVGLRYAVLINDGEFVTLDEEFGYLSQYEDVEISYSYTHGEI